MGISHPFAAQVLRRLPGQPRLLRLQARRRRALLHRHVRRRRLPRPGRLPRELDDRVGPPVSRGRPAPLARANRHLRTRARKLALSLARAHVATHSASPPPARREAKRGRPPAGLSDGYLRDPCAVWTSSSCIVSARVETKHLRESPAIPLPPRPARYELGEKIARKRRAKTVKGNWIIRRGPPAGVRPARGLELRPPSRTTTFVAARAHLGAPPESAAPLLGRRPTSSSRSATAGRRASPGVGLRAFAFRAPPSRCSRSPARS